MRAPHDAASDGEEESQAAWLGRPGSPTDGQSSPISHAVDERRRLVRETAARCGTSPQAISAPSLRRRPDIAVPPTEHVPQNPSRGAAPAVDSSHAEPSARSVPLIRRSVAESARAEVMVRRPVPAASLLVDDDDDADEARCLAPPKPRMGGRAVRAAPQEAPDILAILKQQEQQQPGGGAAASVQ